MKQVNIYVCSSIKGVRASKGVIGYILEFVKEGQEPITLTKFEGVEGMTANQAAVAVIIKALKRMNTACDLNIYSSSDYVISAVNQWIAQWKENGWLNKKGKPVANKTELIELEELLKQHNYLFKNEKHSYSEWMNIEMNKWRNDNV